MAIANGVSEELRNAAAAHGPTSQPPGYVRTPFPLAALPLVLRGFVQEVADAIGVAPECVATHAIATCAAAIGNTCQIRLKKSWTEPCVIWALTLMESGSLKSPSYHAAVEPLHAAQRLWQEQFEKGQEHYRKTQAQFEADATFWKSSQSDAAQAPPAEPVAPKPVDLYTHDTTVEALVGLLANNPRGLALTRDELSGFFQSFGAYKGGRGGDEAAYLEFYNAKPVKVNRASGKRLYAPHTALSIFGTCQPAVFKNLIGLTGRGSNQVDNGMASRFLIAAPEATPQRWQDDKAFDTQPYHDLVMELLEIPMPTSAEGRHEPVLIEMLPEAKERFHAFLDEHGSFTETIANAPLRWHYRKLAAIAARLALIFYLCDVATKQLSGPLGVQERHMLAGIEVARWYGCEAQRFYEGDVSQVVWEMQEQQKQLLADIRLCNGKITPRLMGRLRTHWHNAEVAEMALRDLERLGYGKCGMQPSGPKGGGQSFGFTLYAQGPNDRASETPRISQPCHPTANEGGCADEDTASAEYQAMRVKEDLSFS